MKPKKPPHILFAEKQIAHIKSLFSFGQVNNWQKALELCGYEKGEIGYIYGKEQLERKITFIELKALLSNYLYGKENPYVYSIGPISQPSLSDKTEPKNSNNSIIYLPNSQSNNFEEKSSKEKETLLTSPNQIAKLRKFQSRAAKALLAGILTDKKRAQLLRANAGWGKTFIIGGVLRQLEDSHFIESHNCISPWPIVWITRASVVEQTRRVCEDKFGLDCVNRVIVINIEQLRAKFGEWMLECKTVVKYGEESIEWTWKPKYHPMIFIIDESHLAKNEYSTQTKIICALAKLDKESEVYIINVSATPFTRVCEAKYFAVNTWKNI